MNPRRPLTDLEDLVAASVDQAVEERLIPAIDRLDRATKRLEDVTPLLERIHKRQNVIESWLIIISLFVGALAGYVINHIL